MSKEKPDEAEKKSGAGDPRAVDKWRDVLFPRQSKTRPHAELWKHGAAATLHDWPLHEHHANAPMELARADYEAACEAASKTDARGNYVPHPAALSPYSPRAKGT